MRFGVALLFAAGCAAGPREARLQALVDPALRAGDVAAAVRAAEPLGGLDGRRRRVAAETVVWSSLRSRDASERLRATEIVAEVADPALDRELPARLGDPDPRVRAVAAVALADQAPAARTVLAAALASSDPAARAIAAGGIAHAPDPAAQAARLAADPDPRVRATLAETLARFSPPDHAADRLLTTLAADADAGVRAAALRALGARGDRQALPAVEHALADPALAPRLAAVWAFGRLGARPSELAALAPAGVATPLERYVALRAAVALARLDHADLALAAVRAAAADRRPEVREAAMNAAGQLGDEGARIAAPLLHDPDPAVRLSAARAMVAAGRPEPALRVLRAALSGPLRLDAAEELDLLGQPDGRAALDEAACSRDAAIRRQAIARLAPLAGAGPVLTRALADGDFGVRLPAAEALLRRALHPRTSDR